MSKITTASVRAWTSKMRGPTGPGSSTAAKCYRLLRTIMGTALEDGLIPANPCTIKGAGKEPESKRPVVPVAQAFELADLVGPRFRSLVLLAAFGGLRKGEMLGLRRRDLDLDVLHRIASIADADLIDTALGLGARIEARDGDGRTPLLSAAETGNDETFARLVERGADLDARDAAGRAARDLIGDSARAERIRQFLAERSREA